MQRTRVQAALVAVLPVVLAGCEHAVWGNVMALGMTLCLFFGTLQLGKRASSVSRETHDPRASVQRTE